MFRIIGATVVYGLAIIGLAKLLSMARLERDRTPKRSPYHQV